MKQEKKGHDQRLPITRIKEEQGPLYALHFSSFFTPPRAVELKFHLVKIFTTMDKAKDFIRATLAARGLTEADLDDPLDEYPYVRSNSSKHRLFFSVDEVGIDGLGMVVMD